MTNKKTDKKTEEAKAKLRLVKEKYAAMTGKDFPDAPVVLGAVTCHSLITAAGHMMLLAIQANAAGDDAGPYIEMSNMFQTAADAQGC
jgi:hypothetical protein